MTRNITRLEIHLQSLLHLIMERGWFSELVAFRIKRSVNRNSSKQEHLRKRDNIPWKTSSQAISASRPPSTRMSSCRLACFPPPRTAGRNSPSLTILSSMPRLTGSAMPYTRRKVSIFMASCVARHANRRASSGCVDVGAGM